MKRQAKDGDQNGGRDEDCETANSVSKQAETQLKEIFESVADFQERFIRLVKSGRQFKLRLEIQGDRFSVSDIDLNEFIKRRPKHDPKPTSS